MSEGVRRKTRKKEHLISSKRKKVEKSRWHGRGRASILGCEKSFTTGPWLSTYCTLKVKRNKKENKMPLWPSKDFRTKIRILVV